MGKKDNKPAKDTSKGSGGKGGKGKGGGGDDSNSGGGKQQKGAQSINVRHILCNKMGEAEKAIERLQAGESFNTVAQEMSQDKARSGGSLGWKTKGSLLPEFEKIAYELPTSTTNKPSWGMAKTSEGYHVIMVEGRK
ncbi:FKBP-like protein [Triangularia verruculosa]|uniref:Peptidyl-prolyl cis-trans isomerase n=1 Tax=Triangularia verruculosa TaxID=2587418 RepID=A0AAN6XNW9_9PEZI|nr:FKBP-like protein [Triangularia verruculosa]